LGQADKNIDFFLRHRGELIEYASKVVGDRSRGEDIVQDAFLRFKASVGDRALEEPLGYLRRLVRNLSIDWLRHSISERNRTDAEADFEALVETRPGQEEAMGHREELNIVMAAMAELPQRTRIALEMHRIDGFKLKEIADHLHISVALAHSLVYEGLAHCRSRLNEALKKGTRS